MRRCTGTVVGAAASCAVPGLSALARHSVVGLRSFAITTQRHKDVRRHDFGDSRRLSFNERSERRTPKTREEKQAKEQLLRDAEAFADVEFPDLLEKAYERVRDRCVMLHLRIVNIARCLEALELDASGNAGSSPKGQKMLLFQAAQVVKTKPNELEVTPTVPSLANAILHRICKFDASIQAVREQGKIRVVLPQMTTARREKAAADIKAQITDLRQRTKGVRQDAAKILQGLGVDDSVLNQQYEVLDEKVAEFLEAKTLELEMLADEVLTMGADESDAAAEAETLATGGSAPQAKDA